MLDANMFPASGEAFISRQRTPMEAVHPPVPLGTMELERLRTRLQVFIGGTPLDQERGESEIRKTLTDERLRSFISFLRSELNEPLGSVQFLNPYDLRMVAILVRDGIAAELKQRV